jgi:3-hydroxyacyl-[acyl-carrier-protein] dehydratase
MADIGVDIQGIMAKIPHRYPFLLVDRVLEIVPGSHIRALKNVSINEPYFQGHFPGLPVMPGVLMLEALAQTGGLYVLHTADIDMASKVFMFTSMNKVKFRRPVVPGDQIILKMSDFRHKMTLWSMQGVAEVNGETVCEASLSAALVDKEKAGGQ